MFVCSTYEGVILILNVIFLIVFMRAPTPLLQVISINNRRFEEEEEECPPCTHVTPLQVVANTQFVNVWHRYLGGAPWRRTRPH
jgi:hypothetical protein